MKISGIKGLLLALILLIQGSALNAVTGYRLHFSGTVKSVSDDGIIEFVDSEYRVRILSYCDMKEGRKPEPVTDGWKIRLITVGRKLTCESYSGIDEAKRLHDTGGPISAHCRLAIKHDATYSVGMIIDQFSNHKFPYSCSNWEPNK